MANISKSTRELYSNIRSELIGIHYRVILVRQLFTSQDTNDLLNNTAIRFFAALKGDLMNTIAIAISRLTDPAKSFNKFKNASLQQIIESIDNRCLFRINPLLDGHSCTDKSKIIAYRKLAHEMGGASRFRCDSG